VIIAWKNSVGGLKQVRNQQRKGNGHQWIGWTWGGYGMRAMDAMFAAFRPKCRQCADECRTTDAKCGYWSQQEQVTNERQIVFLIVLLIDDAL